MAFLGLCGRFKNQCTLAWSSNFKNKVGTYPSNLLPARRTLWYASAGNTFSFSEPSVQPGGGGLPLLGLFSATGLATFQTDSFRSKSHFTLIFAKTVNRINRKYVLTEADLSTLDTKKQTLQINVGEYIFEALAVTDHEDIVQLVGDLTLDCPNSIRQSTKDAAGTIVTFNVKATGGKGKRTVVMTPNSGSKFAVGKTTVNVNVKDEDDNSANCSFIVEVVKIASSDSDFKEVDDPNDAAIDEDVLFRKLFATKVPPEKNRFIKVVINQQSLEYRLDNNRTRTVQVIDNSGQGDLRSPSYRDASSKILEIDFVKLREPTDAEKKKGEVKRQLKIGDTVYLTYVGVVKHYIRQRVNITWGITAMGLPAPQAHGTIVDVKVSNYRFYEWNLEKKNPNDTNEKLVRIGGWRVVETFNSKPQYTALVIGKVLGDFCAGDLSGIQTIEYLPGLITASQLNDFISGIVPLPSYQTNFNLPLNDSSYHLNVGNQSAYKQTAWYKRSSVNSNYSKNIQHILFNVHPNALKKRDLDKWGLERFMAQEIEKDIQQGKQTGFPFMDDATVDNPTESFKETLSSANCHFDPIKPISRYGLGNAEIDAGIGGGALLSEPGSGDDVFGYMTFASNLITEPFDKETRILVERHFTTAQRGEGIVAIQGAPATAKSISAILDPSQTYTFVFHSSNDDRLAFNFFRNGYVDEGMSKLEYRPDLGTPNTTSDTPDPKDFVELLGWTGMLGDVSGYHPGRLVTTSSFITQNDFLYITNNKSLFENRGLPISQMQDLESINIVGNTLTVKFSPGFHGRMELDYSVKSIQVLSKPLQATVKYGGRIVGVIDSVYLWAAKTQNNLVQIDLRWMSCDQIDITGEPIGSIVGKPSILVSRLVDAKADDFLFGSGDITKREGTDIITKRPVFFSTNAVSVAEDEKSTLYVFFEDRNNGISCAVSRDFGHGWQYYYGIVEAIAGEKVGNPYVINFMSGNKCYLFYSYSGKILCKTIKFDAFDEQDACVIEKTDDIIKEETDKIVESTGVYSKKGRDLRRHTLSYAAAGDLTDIGFRELTTRITYIIGSGNDQETHSYPKRPLAIGVTTAFANRDISSSFFSGYRKDNGSMKLFFLGETDASVGGGLQLQCHFSDDDGICWFDLWELAKYGNKRLKADKNSRTQFIDRSAINNKVEAVDPKQSNQNFQMGINVHKKRGIKEVNNVYEIQSPYVFCQATTHKIFLFYIFENCLLCKTFNDSIFEKEYDQIKKIIEDDTKSEFIDGNLLGTEMSNELENKDNPDGNVQFAYQHAQDKFEDGRTVIVQRVCACELPNGNIRVFYKSSNQHLRSSVFNGTRWMPEDMLKDPNVVGRWKGV